jgi:sterol desaturase/sphingolipid hydroxylase (fatty acid hydroxylase superfamily)
MARFVSKRDETVKLFDNPVLEYFSRAHPATPLFYAPILIYFAYVGCAEQGLLLAGTLFLGGFLIWTLTEYWVHRALFHFQPRSAWGKRMHYWWHGVHHDYPGDSRRLVMPLMSSLPLAALFFLAFRLLAGEWHPALFAGFALGYITYDLTHYAIHHWRLANPVFRWLKTHHLKHHFTDEATGYGVSTPLWDYVFRTAHRSVPYAARPAAQPASPPTAAEATLPAPNG